MERTTSGTRDEVPRTRARVSATEFMKTNCELDLTLINWESAKAGFDT